MIRFVLDTDILSLLQQGNVVVQAHVASHPATELATTVITVEEQLSGWYHLLRQAKTAPRVAMAYSRLAQSVQSLSQLQILAFPESAIARFEQLKSLKIGVRAPDLRIAAIVLHLGVILVTRNVRDFRLVPGLQIQDWTQP